MSTSQLHWAAIVSSAIRRAPGLGHVVERAARVGPGVAGHPRPLGAREIAVECDDGDAGGVEGVDAWVVGGGIVEDRAVEAEPLDVGGVSQRR